ncbi:hypothetical protein D9757_005073 [Collybiopsis confluens]|uniref:Uncharacterized protein n=1 Tax=Collybiopsis confluens TaxID=2823264 RepID=A0A8H5HSY4_9AGAR|nr:hypothetical protein D9757_005073 [Collybiopsis confluens]
MAKKRKISGLSGIELMQACTALKRLRSSLVEEEEEEEEETVDQVQDNLPDSLKDMISKLESRLSGPQTLNFSRVDAETLKRLNIVQQRGLIIKSGAEERSEKSKLIGKDELWSSTNMQLHLALLDKLVSKENEATCRAWIDTFFFRASAMVDPGKSMVLNMEQVIPATAISPTSMATISGFTDYAAVVTESRAAAVYRKVPRVETARLHETGFFVTEAKKGPLYDHVPQAVCQLYASGKQLEKDTIRGALTNGHEWMFIILSFNKDGNGASYKYSIPLEYRKTRTPNEETPEQSSPDVIACILLEWIQKSFQDLDTDDWFEEIAKSGSLAK